MGNVSLDYGADVNTKDGRSMSAFDLLKRTDVPTNADAIRRLLERSTR